jgi:hypothetical protein
MLHDLLVVHRELLLEYRNSSSCSVTCS